MLKRYQLSATAIKAIKMWWRSFCAAAFGFRQARAHTWPAGSWLPGAKLRLAEPFPSPASGALFKISPFREIAKL